MFVLDRIEGKWAVISSDAGTFNLPISLLPEGSREGDILNIRVEVDHEKTAAKKAELQKLMEELAEE